MQALKTDPAMTKAIVRVLACEHPFAFGTPAGTLVIPPNQLRINLQVEELVVDPKITLTDGLQVGLQPCFPGDEED